MHTSNFLKYVWLEDVAVKLVVGLGPKQERIKTVGLL